MIGAHGPYNLGGFATTLGISEDLMEQTPRHLDFTAKSYGQTMRNYHKTNSHPGIGTMETFRANLYHYAPFHGAYHTWMER